MLSYELWKVVHIAAILLLFGSLGGAAAIAAVGATKAQGKLFAILHGIAMTLVFLAGFGLLAKLGLNAPTSWPPWVWVKLVVWLALGAALAMVRRAGSKAGMILLILVALGAVAAWAALTKPGM